MSEVGGILFGQVNIFFFVAGCLLNTLVCWMRWRNVRSSVDICVIMISLSNWITVFLDLFVGIHNAHANSTEDKSSPFYSEKFIQFWGFFKVVNWEWITALMALLTFSNIAKSSRLHTILLGAGWFVIESVLMAVPMMLGARFLTGLFYPTPFPDYTQFLGNNIRAPKVLAWFFLVDLLPYTYFVLVTALLLLVNCFNYSNMRQGYLTHSLDDIKDTKMVIAYSLSHLLTEIPAVLFYMSLTWFILFDPDMECRAIIRFGFQSHLVYLFLSSARCVLIPMIFLITRYGLTGVFTRPAKFALDRWQAQVRYKRFHGEQNVSLAEIENDGEEP